MAGADGVALAPGAVMILLALYWALVSRLRAVSSMRTLTWGTTALPVAAGLNVASVEVIRAVEPASEYEATGLTMALALGTIVVAWITAQRTASRWKSGVVTVALFVHYVAVSVAALLGIPLDTFGDHTRNDELLLLGALPLLPALMVAVASAPSLPAGRRVTGVLLLVAAATTAVAGDSDGGPLSAVALGAMAAVVRVLAPAGGRPGAQHRGSIQRPIPGSADDP